MSKNNFIEQFKAFLLSSPNSASRVTVKNYASDINHFLAWFENQNRASFNPIEVTSGVIATYKNANEQALSASSMQRHLSSLRKFFNFLKIEGRISYSPFEQDRTASAEALAKADPWQLKDFKNNLFVNNAAHLTIKNYIIDVKQFIAWVTRVTGIEGEILTKRINADFVEEYKSRLLDNAGYSPATINRKLSSLRRYLNWASDQGMLENKDLSVANIENAKAKLYIPTSAELEIRNLKLEIPNTKYSAFPPLRLLQKVTGAAILALDSSLIIPLAKTAEKAQLAIWRLKGQPVFEKGPASIVTKNITPQDLLGIKNISKYIYAPFDISTKSFSIVQKTIFRLKHSRPKWYKRYHSYAITHYFHFAILIIFLAALGFGIYNAFFIKAGQNPLFATTPPVAPPRILSFQGRLTDNNDNPITANTNIRFAIYDTLAASGSSLLWQEVDPVAPDTDGIFNSLLGNVSAIPSTLFANNSALYLGVTIETTPELTPRQQLATVAFAANSETLQGLLPITNSGGATTNVVLALDSSGNLTIGGSANPVFSATGGTFKLSGQPLLLTTNLGSNGNVQVTTDGLGKIDLQKPLQNTSISNNVSTARGSVEVDDLFSVLATSSGQSAFTLNQDGTGPLISASTSGVAKFTVDNSGNETLAGNLTLAGTTGITLSGSGADLTFTGGGTNTISSTGTLEIGAHTLTGAIAGNSQNLTGLSQLSATSTITFSTFTGNNAVLYATTGTGVLGSATSSTANQCLLSGASATYTPSWGSCSTGTSISPFQQGAGFIYPNNSTSDFLIGGQATTSAKFAVLNVNSGTPVASVSSGLNGYGSYLTADGTLATTRRQTLTIGNSSLYNTTGNVLINPNGTGNVGIGTTTPAVSLDINGALRTTVGTAGTNVAVQVGSAGRGLSAQNGILELSDNGYEVMRIIGASGVSPFEVRQQSGTIRLMAANAVANTGISLEADGNGSISFATNAGSGSPTQARVSHTASAVNYLNFTGAATTANPAISVLGSDTNIGLKIDGKGTGNILLNSVGTGNVGIGTTGPGEKLEVAGGNIEIDPSYTIGSVDGFTVGGSAGQIDFGIKKSSADTRFAGMRVSEIVDNAANLYGTIQFFTDSEAADFSTERMRITGRGLVGIGNTSPLTALDVTGSASLSANLSLRGAATAHTFNILDNGTLNIQRSPGGDAGLTTALFVQNNGNVGIGTTGPGANLHVNGTGSTEVRIQSTAASQIPSLRIIDNDNGDFSWEVGRSSVNGLRLFDNTASATRLMVDGSGNFAIGSGNATPLATLDVRGNSGTTPIASISGQTSFAALVVDNKGVGDIFTASTSGYSRFTITNQGNVVMGKSGDPGKNITIYGSGTAPSSISLLGTSGNGVSLTSGYNGVDSELAAVYGLTITAGNGTTGDITFRSLYTGSYVNQLRILGSNNNVGIGTITPASELHVTRPLSFGANGKALAVFDQIENQDIFTASASGTPIFTVTRAGGIALGTNGLSYGTSSQCLVGGTTASWSSCSAAASNYWQLNSGALSPFSNTADLLIGDTASSTAEFAFTGMSSLTHQTQASFSGNLIVMPNNGFGGNVGIGTTNPASKSDIYSTGTGLEVLQRLSKINNNSPIPVMGFDVTNGTEARAVKAGIGFERYQANGGGVLEFFNASSGNGVDITGNRTTPGDIRMVIDYGGNVGINSTSPGTTLDVVGNSGTLAAGRFTSTSSFATLEAINSGVGDLFTASAGATTKFVINNAGNVGIGLTSNIDSILSINANAANTSGAGGISLLGSNQNYGSRMTVYDTGTGIQAQFLLKIGGAYQTPAIVIGGAGGGQNVGIGTTGPNAKLESFGTTEQLRLTYDATHYTSFTVASDGRLNITPTGDASVNDIYLGGTTLQLGSLVGGVNFSYKTIDRPGTVDFRGTDWQINNNAVGLHVFQAAGNVGIGTTGPQGILHVASTSNGANDDLILNQAATTNLIKNPSFETNTTNWANVGTGVISRVTTDSKFGAASGNVAVTANLDGANYDDGVLPVAQATYAVSYWIKAKTAGDVGKTVAAFADTAGGTYEQFGIGSPTLTANWVRMTATVTWANAGHTRAVLHFRDQTSQGAFNFLLDGVQYELSSVVTPYADGSFGPGYYWNGTPNNSTSTRTAGAAFAYQTINSAGGLGAASRSNFPTLQIDQNGTGDIFAASASGISKFTIANSGALTDAAYTNAGGLLYTSTTGLIGQTAIGTASQCLLGGTTPSFGSCSAGGTDSPFQVLSGAIVPNNSTLDLLIGGQATTSAKFAIIGVNGTRGTQTASLSGSLALDSSTASIQTTNGQTLTLGGTSTGLINVNNKAGSAFTAFDTVNSRVGIGTTSPISKLDIRGLVTVANTDYIEGSVGSKVQITQNASSGNTDSQIQAYTAGATAYGNLSLQPSGGNVGIGDTTPASLLTVGASDAFQVNSSGNIVNIGGAAHTIQNSSGALAIDSATTGAINIGTGANAKTITIGNATTTTALAFNSGTGAQTFTSLATSGTAFSFVGNSVNTGTGFSLTGNALSTGTLAALSSTSTALSTGGLLSLDWSPGSATTATGDLLSLNIGANGILANIFNVKDNGSSVFSVSQTAVTSNLPTNFTSPGDVSIAYDINFTNPTASYIKSAAPLYLEAGESFGSSDLTLRTFGKGNVIVDSEAFVTNYAATVSGQLVLGTSTAPANIGNFYLTNSSTFGKALAILNQTESQDIFTASASGTPRFVIQNGGNVGIGTTAPSSALEVNGGIEVTNLYDTAAATGDNFFDGGCSATTSITGIDSTGAITCTAITGVPASSIAFSGITSGTNTVAAMVVGAGASLNYTSTGTINASSLVGATWIAPGTIGSTTPNTGAFTTLTSSGNSTIGTGASSANTMGAGSTSTNIIGSVTTPGALTLHGATTLDNTFTVSGSFLTSLGGNLTVTGTAWTATPTISGLITATSGLTSNGTIAANAAGGITTNQTTFNLVDATATTINFAGGATTLLDLGSATGATVGVPSLTASRFVLSDGTSKLISSGASSVLLNTLTDETGSGVAVFGTSPTITTSIVTGTSFTLGAAATTALTLGSSTANTVNVPSLSASSAVYTDASKNLTSTAPGSGTIGYWQRTLGSLAPTNITDSLNLGATATSSALVHLAGTAGENSWINTGNVGIGTTNPQRKLDLSNAGQITFGDDVVTSSTNGIYWHSGSGYGIYRTSGAWTASTYQQLNIEFDTGIIINPGSGTYDKSYVGVVGGMSIGDTYYTTKYDNGLIVQGNVGIGTTSPTGKLTVGGNISASAWGLNGINLQIPASTYTDTSSSGTVATVAINSIAAPTIAATSSTTYTKASSMYIAGGPTAGSNVTLTSQYGLYIDTFTGVTNAYGIYVNEPTGASNTYGIRIQYGAEDIQLTGGAIKTTQGFMNNSSQNNSWYKTLTTGAEINRNVADSNVALIIKQAHASSTGDILQLANSAATVFNVSQTGKVGIGDTSPTALLTVGASDVFQVNSSGAIAASTGVTLTSGAITLSASTGTTSTCLLGGATASWGSCASGTSVSPFQQGAGFIYPNNSTVDFLIGGQSTSSAKFAVLNIAVGTPVASVSSATLGLALQGDGTIQTTRNNTLTIGGDKTGNIKLSPNNAAAGGKVLPGADNLVSLGATATARFKDLFLGPGSLHVQCITGDGCSQGTDYEVGINTASNDFTIKANNTTQLFLSNSGALNARNFVDLDNRAYFLDPAASGTSMAVVGNVGIGTTNPGTKLDVVGTVTWTGGNSSHLGTGVAVTTYVGNSSVNNALVRSNSNTEDAWVMNWGDSAIWGIYNRNIDSTLVVGGAIDVPANSTAFIGNGLAKAYIEHASGNAGFAGTLAVGGTVTGGTYNSQTISSAANFTGTMAIADTLSVDGSITQLTTHGDNMKLWLSAARNSGGTGEVGLYSWISEPGQTWTGGGIARNMYNTTAFPRVNTGLSGQMMRFAEGNTIEFTIETAAGVRTTPFTIANDGITTSGTITSGLINSQTISAAANFTGSLTVAGTFDPNGAITLPTTGISGAGSGSGLDADLLDGQHGSYYTPIGNISGTTNYVAKFTGANSVGNSAIYETGGNVGIGSTAPPVITNNTALELYGGWYSSIDLGGNGTHSMVRLSTDGSGLAYLKTLISTSLNLGTNNTTNMTILNGGNVGIGTTSPAVRLVSEGGTANINVFTNAGAEAFDWPEAGLSVRRKDDYTTMRMLQLGHSADPTYVIADDTVWNLNLKDNTGSKTTSDANTDLSIDGPGDLILSPTGNVGIGTTAPTATLDLTGGLGVSARASIFGNQSNGGRQRYVPYGGLGVPRNLTAQGSPAGATTSNDGTITWSNTTQAWTWGWTGPSYSRLGGRAMEFTVDTTGVSTAQADHFMIGWGNGNSMTGASCPTANLNYTCINHALYFDKSISGVYTIFVYEAGVQKSNLYTATWGDTIHGMIVLRTTGAYYYIKKNNEPNWRLMYSNTTTDTTAALYPQLAGHSGRYTVHDWNVYDQENLAYSTGDSYLALDSGNVGIGTTAPYAKLTSSTSATDPASGIDSFALTATGSYGGGIGLQDGTGNFGIWTDTTGTVARFGFGTSLGALTTQMSLTNAGNLSTTGTMTGTTLNGTTGINTGASAGTQRIDASGNLVNIGTITSGLINSQTISATANFTGSLTVAGTFDPNGAVTLPTTGISGAGSGSGLDADLLDSIDSSRIVYGDGARGKSTSASSMNDLAQPSGFYFYNSPTGAPTAEWTNWITMAGNSWSSPDGYAFQLSNSFWNSNLYTRRMQSGAWQSWNLIWHGGNDGAGSTLDADLLDGISSAGFCQTGGAGCPASAVTSVTGTANQITSSPTTGAVVLSIPSDFRGPGTVNAVTSINTGAGAGTARIDASGNITAGTITSGLINSQTISATANFTGSLTVAGTFDPNGAVTLPTTGISGAGSGSGLDADLLDSYSSASFAGYYGAVTDIHAVGGQNLYTFFSSSTAAPTNCPLGGTCANWVQGMQFPLAGNGSYRQLLVSEAGNLYYESEGGGVWGGWRKIWDSGNDGSGSGLDADLWDGNNFATYLNQAVLTTSNVTFGTITSGTINGQTISSAASFTSNLNVAGNLTGNYTYASTQFYGPAGSVTAPSYSWSADPNTGMYNSAADTLMFVTGGVQQLAISTGAIAAAGSLTTAGYLAVNGAQQGARLLSVNGNVDFYGMSNTGAGDRYMCMTTTGKIVREWTGTCTASSLRYKHDIQNLDYGLADIMKLRPVSYIRNDAENTNWLESRTLRQIGFIAEDMNLVIPEVVARDEIGRPDSIDYPMLTSLLAIGIQQQQLQIMNSRDRIASIEAELSFNNNGNLSILDNTLAIDPNFTVPHFFTLNDALGNPVDRIGAFGEIIVAKLTAGFISAGQITTKSLNVATANVSIAGQSLNSYIAAIVNNILDTRYQILNTDEVISPLASIDTLHTNLISPLAEDSDISVSLENSKFEIRNSKNASGSAVASIDSRGLATFKGINTDSASISGNLSAQSASISGDLRVRRLIADQIEGLDIKTSTISAQYITNNYYTSTPSGQLLNGSIVNIATNSSFPTFAATWQQSNNGTIQQYISLAPFASEFAYVENLNAANATFSQGLTVYGSTTLSDTSVVGQLAISGSLILADNSINVLGSDLKLQPLRQGGISIMAGLIYIDTNGNAKFGKDVTVDGTLYANTISPKPGSDLTIKLGSNEPGSSGSKLRINNASGSALLVIDQLGNLIASGAATIAKLNLNNIVSPALAVSPTEVIATGSAGTGKINVNRTEMTINNPLVTEKSLIYITPSSNTNNQVLYLLRQVSGESFTVGIQNPSTAVIPFNWIIVN